MVEDRQFVELFLEEERIQSRIRHGNIVQVYDFGEADGAYYLALELVDGVDLRRFLAETPPLPIGLCAYIARELCHALAYVHRLRDDGESLHVFGPASWELVECAGALPAEINVQNCFEYRYTPGALVRVSRSPDVRVQR